MSQVLALVPGLNNTAAVFDKVAQALPSSVTPVMFTNPPLASVDALAQYWLDQLPARFWLAGFSFGGYVAMAMLAQAPERVRGLAMICTTPGADGSASAAKRLVALEAVAQGRYLEMVDRQLANAVHPDTLSNEAVVRARQAMVRDYGAERYAAHVRATAARPDRSHLLDGSMPTLFVTTSHDRVIGPATVLAYADQVANAQVAVVENAGHLVPMEQPLELARILSAWMDSSAPQGR